MTEVLQKLLDRSVSHIRAQGKPSIRKMSRLCAYRGENNTMCGAGIFIQNYNEAMDDPNVGGGISWTTLCKEYPDAIEQESIENELFVANVLQIAHDIAATSYYKNFLNFYEIEIKRLVKQWNCAYHTNLIVN